VPLDELLDLATALADQRHHPHVTLGIATDHAEQRALADARAGEDAEPLAAPAGDEAVDGAHAGRQRVLDRDAAERAGRRAAQARLVAAAERAEVVQRPTQAVDHPPQEFRTDRHAERGLPWDDPAAGAHSA